MKHHGEAKLYWQGSILVVEAHGPFNEEGMQIVVKNIKQCVFAKHLPVWQKLSICDKETLGSPSTLAVLQDINTWCANNGCEKMAVVVCTSLQNYIAEHQLKSAAKIFFDENEAKQWLLAHPISQTS